MYKLRYYQGWGPEGACQAVLDYFTNGGKGNPLIALATGTGKSLVQAELIRYMVDTYPHTRVLCLTHVKELIENNHRTLCGHAPHLAPLAGIYSAGVGQKDVGAQVTFAGIQSIYKRARLFGKTNIVFIDEAHLVGESGTSQYITFLVALRALNPNLKIIGLTATAYRMGMGMLTDGTLFDEVVFDITEGDDFMRLVHEGYLARLVPKRMETNLDTSEVKLLGGEFSRKGVQEAMQEQDVIERALDEAMTHAADRKHWLVFANSIENVDEITARLMARGVMTAAVHSKMSQTYNYTRDQAVEAYQQGKVRALVNQDILTTGFDAPHTDALIVLRPTRSPGLWVQILGRGTRPSPETGKENCLVLDFVGNTTSLGPINYPQKPKPRRKSGGEPPVRECPNCQTWVHISVYTCPECGYEFPPPESKLRGKAGTDELMLDNSKPPEQRVVAVGQLLAQRHEKEGKPDSVKVTYTDADDGYTYHEWVGFEHPHPYVRHRAESWWMAHRTMPEARFPTSTDDLLDRFDDEVRIPHHIRVQKDGRYWRVVDYDFVGHKFQLMIQPPFQHLPQRTGSVVTPHGTITDDEIPF